MHVLRCTREEACSLPPARLHEPVYQPRGPAVCPRSGNVIRIVFMQAENVKKWM